MTNKEFVLNAMKQVGTKEALSFRSRAIEKSLNGTEIIANENWIPEWRQGKYEVVGAPVRFNGQVYKVWQEHDSTGQSNWNPELGVSLFDICHTNDPLRAKPYMMPQGTRGLYYKNECCLWTDGMVYRSLVDSNAYSPESYAQNWAVVTDEAEDDNGGVGEITEQPVAPTHPNWSDLVEGYAFSVGDIFIDNGATYEVLRVFNKQSNWRPPALIDNYYKVI